MKPHDDNDERRVEIPTGGGDEPRAGVDPPIERVRSLREVEVEHVQYALRVSNGNKKQAALALGISRDTLYRKIAEFAPTSSDPAAPVAPSRRRPR